MQFGRIDGNAYILDFQYPFSAVQAFAVALANVTQRLKWRDDSVLLLTNLKKATLVLHPIVGGYSWESQCCHGSF